MSKFLKIILPVLILPVLFQFCATVPEFLPNEYVISVTQGNVVLGDIDIKMFEKEAPLHVRNFDSLVTIGFYNGTAFHRVIPGFMIQGGDPNTREPFSSTNPWGSGQKGQTRVNAEFSKTLTHTRGIISAARTNDPNSATSQFFICHQAAKHLDGKYSIYGEVTKGMDVVDKIAAAKKGQSDRPLVKIEMNIKKKLNSNR